MITNSILKPFTPEEELNNQIHDCYLPVSANHENRAKYRPGPKNVVYANYYIMAMNEFYAGDISNGIKNLTYALSMRINDFMSVNDMYRMYDLIRDVNIYAGDPVKVV